MHEILKIIKKIYLSKTAVYPINHLLFSLIPLFQKPNHYPVTLKDVSSWVTVSKFNCVIGLRDQYTITNPCPYMPFSDSPPLYQA